MHTSKEDAYRELVKDAKDSYASKELSLYWHPECKEINLWTYWQGRSCLDAKIMLESPNTLQRFEGKAKRVKDLRSIQK